MEMNMYECTCFSFIQIFKDGLVKVSVRLFIHFFAWNYNKSEKDELLFLD